MFGRAEVVRERERQAEHARHLRAVAARAEQPQVGTLSRAGTAVMRLKGWSAGNVPSKKAMQLAQLLGKVVGGDRGRVRRSAAAVSWSVPGARPMPRSMRPGMQRLEHAELLGDASGAWLGSITPPEPTRIVDVAAAMCADQHRGRRAGDARHVVVLGDPVAVVAQPLDVAREVNGVAQGNARRLAARDRREIKD